MMSMSMSLCVCVCSPSICLSMLLKEVTFDLAFHTPKHNHGVREGGCMVTASEEGGERREERKERERRGA